MATFAIVTEYFPAMVESFRNNSWKSFQLPQSKIIPRYWCKQSVAINFAESCGLHRGGCNLLCAAKVSVDAKWNTFQAVVVRANGPKESHRTAGPVSSETLDFTLRTYEWAVCEELHAIGGRHRAHCLKWAWIYHGELVLPSSTKLGWPIASRSLPVSGWIPVRRLLSSKEYIRKPLEHGRSRNCTIRWHRQVPGGFC
jgi:hypothetical protein